MATYINIKCNAFRKQEDVGLPFRKRSESRLKRYGSTHDPRAWTLNTFDKKAHLISFMGAETPPIKSSFLGQVVPIDALYKIMLVNKNEVIALLEQQIQCFVELLYMINLSGGQVERIQYLASTTFHCIKDLLMPINPTHVTNDYDIENGVQVPYTLTTITETSEDNAVAMKILLLNVVDMASQCDIRSSVDQSNATIQNNTSHVSIQVVLAPKEMCDKCVAVKLHSAAYLAKKQSRCEQAKHKAALAANSKSQADASCKAAEDIDAASTKSHKSCVTFTDTDNANNACTELMAPSAVMRTSSSSMSMSGTGTDVSVSQHHAARASSVSGGNAMSMCQLGEEPLDAVVPIMCEMVSIATTTIVSVPIGSSGELIEVMSDGEQASLNSSHDDKTASLIQLYKSSKKSMLESTYTLRESDAMFDKDYWNEMGTSTPRLGKAVGVSTDHNKLHALPDDDDDNDDNEKFEDCAMHFMWESHDKETCVTSVVSENYWLQMKGQRDEINRHRLFAKRAMWQLDLIRETILENAETIVQVNIQKITEKLKDSSRCTEEIAELEQELSQMCRDDNCDASTILSTQLQVLKSFCSYIQSDEDTLMDKIDADRRSSSVVSLKSIHSIVVDIPSNTAVTEKKRQQQQIEYWKAKLVKLDQLNLERDKLKDCVHRLETELKLYESIKLEFDLPGVEEFGNDVIDLSVLQVSDIQAQIIDLKRKAMLSDILKEQVNAQSDQIAQMKKSFSITCASRTNDIEALRYQAQQADIIRLERDRLAVKLTDLEKVQRDVKSLQKKCAELEGQKQELLKTIDEERRLQRNLNVYQDQAEEIAWLQSEKESTLRTVIAKQCELADQEDQIERLVMHIDRLTTNNELQQEKSKKLLSQLRCELENKESYIAKMDSELEWVEGRLKESITTISKDSNEWQRKITKLESCCRRYQTKIVSYKDTIETLRQQLNMQEELNKNYSLELQRKTQLLDDMSANGTTVTLDQRMRNVHRMENILKKSHIAVRKVIEQVDKKYRSDVVGFRNVIT